MEYTCPRHHRFSVVAFTTLSTLVLGASMYAAEPANAQTTTVAATTQPAPVVVTTLPGGYQTTSVQFLQAIRQGTNDVLVTWIAPERALSPIVRYRVSVSSPNAAALPPNSQVVVNGNTTSLTIRGLKLNETYTFGVQPETATGPGAPSLPSNSVFMSDGSERKPNGPQSVAVSVLNQTQVQVVWTPPVPKPNVNIAKYRITTSPSTRTIDVPASANTVLLTGFRTGVTYVAKVQAISTENRGSDLTSSTGFAFVASPTQPPITLPPATVPATTTTTTTTTTTLLPLPSPVAVPTLKPASRCTTRAWNPTVLGQPSRLQAGAPTGAYIWTDGRAIHLRTYNNTNTPVRFSGTVSATVSMTTAKFYTEPDADSVSVGRTAASFSFSSAYDLDALRFDGRCVTKLTVRLFLNGQPLPASQIFIGANSINPTSSAFILSR
jgi:hypothetical protein